MLPLKVLHIFGAIIGTLIRFTDNRNKRIADINIAICFPELTPKEHKHLLNKSLIENSKTLIEAFWLWRHPNQAMDKHLGDIKNKQILMRAKESDKGTIFLTPHFGSWEFSGLLTAAHTDFWILYAPPKSAYIEKLSCEGRSGTGATLVSTANLNLKDLIQHLKNGGSVGILPDQVPDGHGGEYAEFFNRKAYTSTLAVKLANKLNCHLVIGYALRNPKNSVIYDTYYFDAPKEMFDSDSAKAVLRMNQCIEEYVLSSPEQYIWGYKRFKKPVAGDANPYRKQT